MGRLVSNETYINGVDGHPCGHGASDKGTLREARCSLFGGHQGPADRMRRHTRQHPVWLPFVSIFCLRYKKKTAKQIYCTDG
eukprot:scaffold214542_cov47-Attheya_sp.AAC.2